MAKFESNWFDSAKKKEEMTIINMVEMKFTHDSEKGCQINFEKVIRTSGKKEVMRSLPAEIFLFLSLFLVLGKSGNSLRNCNLLYKILRFSEESEPEGRKQVTL